MAKTLVLHIGANKTGSSAIQEFLRLNADALAARGLVVAPSELTQGSPVSGQQLPLLEALRENMAEGRRIVAERIASLMKGLPENGQLIVSAENLSNLNGTHELFADAVKRHEVRVVLYIRRQDALLLSSWQQWESKVTDDFWAWAVSAAGRRGDWRLTLEPWEALAGRERICVRIYDRRRLRGGSVIADFAGVLGVDDRFSEFRMPESASNPSYCEAVLDLVKGNRLIFRDIHDNTVYDLIGEMTGERYHRDPRESPITHRQRMALLQKYASVNAWVKNRYFPQLSGPLFPMPKPEDYATIGPETLNAQKWELVASLLNALSTRVLTAQQ